MVSTKIAGGYGNSLALKRDGSLWAWGDNRAGQLGLGDTSHRRHSPRGRVASDWAAVAGRFQCSLALKKDGSLWAWGENWPASSASATPEQVHPHPRRHCPRLGGHRRWHRSQPGPEERRHTLGLGRQLRGRPRPRRHQRQVHPHPRRHCPRLGGHRLRCRFEPGPEERRHTLGLGRQQFGQLGLGDNTSEHTPARVGVASDWAAIACGWDFSLALQRWQPLGLG